MPRNPALSADLAHVDDLEKAVEFYTTALGLRLGRRLFEGSVAEMLGATSTIHLLLKSSASTAVPNAALPRKYQRHWTPVHLDFEVEDVSAAVERAVGAGARLEGEIQSFPWGRLATRITLFMDGRAASATQLKGALNGISLTMRSCVQASRSRHSRRD